MAVNEDESELREIGKDAVWSLSTAKPGNGVEQLRDDNTETYWQSDGTQPHLINIQVSPIDICLSYFIHSFFLSFSLFSNSRHGDPLHFFDCHVCVRKKKWRMLYALLYFNFFCAFMQCIPQVFLRDHVRLSDPLHLPIF